MYDEITFGETIRIYRLRKRMTQQELASLVGVSKTTISNYENGISEPNSYTIFLKISKALGIPEKDIVRFIQDSIGIDQQTIHNLIDNELEEDPNIICLVDPGDMMTSDFDDKQKSL